ncbi:hypothetical protein [Flavobacterium sp.]|nr:hypothetical protein [Flavobacterium sp.]HLF51513.1 hypothetical protein [Flavobacterium sp.]
MFKFPPISTVVWTVLIVVLADVLGITDMVKGFVGGIIPKR